MNTYKTSEIAHSIGIHPNTVRLYEELKLIPKPERKANGYRVFTDFHMEQIKQDRGRSSLRQNHDSEKRRKHFLWDGTRSNCSQSL